MIAIREVDLDQVTTNESDVRESDVLNEEERKRLLSESARLRQAARRQYKTVCRTCGKEIIGNSRRRFCDQVCQRRHWRARLAAMKPGDELPVVE